MRRLSDTGNHPTDQRKGRERAHVQVIPRMIRNVLEDGLGIRDKRAIKGQFCVDSRRKKIDRRIAPNAKPGDRGSPAKAEPGERPWHKSSPLPSGISQLAPETEKPCRPQYRWSYRGTSQSARTQDLTSSRLSQSRGCDKARARTGRPAWLPAPKRQESTIHPDTVKV